MCLESHSNTCLGGAMGVAIAREQPLLDRVLQVCTHDGSTMNPIGAWA